MSMTMLTVLQLTGIIITYFITTLFLPWLLLRKKFERLSLPVQFMAYFVTGNFYIINLVLLLQLVRLSYRVTLIIGTLFPFGLVFCRKNRGHILDLFGKAVNFVRRILERDLTIKTIFDKTIRKWKEKYYHKEPWSRKKFFGILEGILVFAVVILVFIIYGLDLFEGYGYQAADTLVHNEWINDMSRNNVFSKGVYPFGFHCIIYYLHTVYGIKTMTLLRLFCAVQTIMIHLMLLAFMKVVCRSRYIPYLTAAGYVLFDFFGKGSYTRFCSTLPQEYGMIFILPPICFLIEFFRQFKLEQEEKIQTNELKETDTAAKRKFRFRIWRKRPLSEWYLAFFAMSISLTLAIHFYNTMIAGLFCIGVAAGFVTRLVKWKYLKRILIAGVSGIMIAVLPMAVGYAEGKGLQGSLYWGLSVISGENSDDAETEDVIKNREEIQMYDENGELTAEGMINKSLFSQCAYVIARDLINVNLFLVDEKLELYDIEAEILTGKILIFFVPVMILLGLPGVFIQKRKECLPQEYCMTVISVGVYIALLYVLLCSSILGLPELMSNFRTVIFLAYSIMAAAGLFLDAVISYAFSMCGDIRFRNFALFPVSAAVISVVILNDIIKTPVKMFEEYGLKEAVTCTENILRDNKGKDYTWTIVSANDELHMTEEYGRHYETITFLRDMIEIEKNPEITLPTETVYFYIEKQTVLYSDTASEDMGMYVSENGAAEPLYGSSTLGAYKGTDRWITMSHMYYWAQEFMKLYPNEMEVYCETDRFICFRVQQNPYSLYNFAIDYGYNDPKVSEMTDE